MKKIFISILALYLCTACSSAPKDVDSNPVENTPNITEDSKNEEPQLPEDSFFDTVEQKLNDLYPVSETVPMGAELVGAVEGKKYKTAEFKVEVYMFDEDSEAYKNLVETGKLELEGFGQFDAILNGKYAMLANDVPEDFIEVFKNIK